MGSSKFSFLIFFVLLFCSQILQSAPMQLDAPDVFDSPAEINIWAKKKFIGGAECQSFELNNKRVVVIVGQPSSGLVTSEIIIYSGDAIGGKLNIILQRSRLIGIAKAKIEGDTIFIIVSDWNHNDRTILIIPSDGL